MLQVEMDNGVYVWDGKVWRIKGGSPAYGPTLTKLIKLLESFDWDSLPSEELLPIARTMRDNRDTARSLTLIDIVISRNDDFTRSALSTKCSLLRQNGNPEEVITLSDEYICRTGRVDHALLTTRAAAYCDMGWYSNATDEADRAIALNGSITNQISALIRRIYSKGYRSEKMNRLLSQARGYGRDESGIATEF